MKCHPVCLQHLCAASAAGLVAAAAQMPERQSVTLLGVQASEGWEPRLQSIAVPRPSRAGNPIVIARVFIIIFPFIKVVAQPKPYMVES